MSETNVTAAYILRSRNRPGYEAYEPESISAWGEQPDLSMAPVEAWEAVEDLELALAEAPPFALIPGPTPEPVPPTPPNPAEVVKQRILQAMDFGKNLMAEFGASNVLAGRSIAEVAAISDKLGTVQARLLSGSLYAAMAAIDEVVPDELVTGAVIAEFKAKIEGYLGI